MKIVGITTIALCRKRVMTMTLKCARGILTTKIKMKHYDSIPRIQDDGTLKGETVWGYNKLDGQNFCATYNCRKKTWGPYGSRTVTVDENSEQFGPVVKWFKASDYPDILSHIVNANRGKKHLFNGVDEVTFFFEWYGENSFAGKHQEGDEMHLALIDVFLKKKGYIEPEEYEKGNI